MSLSATLIPLKKSLCKSFVLKCYLFLILRFFAVQNVSSLCSLKLLKSLAPHCLCACCSRNTATVCVQHANGSEVVWGNFYYTVRETEENLLQFNPKVFPIVCPLLIQRSDIAKHANIAIAVVSQSGLGSHFCNSFATLPTESLDGFENF